MFAKSWIAWPDATLGQAYRNRINIRVHCPACDRWGTLRAVELIARFGEARLVASLTGRCRPCNRGGCAVAAYFPEGWIEQENAWPRRRAEGL